jgi:hypothetical protein
MNIRRFATNLSILTLCLAATACVVTPEATFKADTGYAVPLYKKSHFRSSGNHKVLKKLSVTVARRYHWSTMPTRSSVEAALRVAARKVNADAVIDVEIGDLYVGLSGREQAGKGTAIKYTTR